MYFMYCRNAVPVFFCKWTADVILYWNLYVGVSFGSFMGVYPGFTADQFGARNNSVNYGIMFIGFALAGYFGPQIMRSVYNSTGIYQNAFLIACGLNIAGIILAIFYRIIRKK